MVQETDRSEANVQKRRPLTRPVSPSISKPHPRPPPQVDEDMSLSPTRGSTRIPDFNKVTLSSLEEERRRAKEELMHATKLKYSPQDEFKLNSTKGVRPIEEVRREIEEQRESELAFDSNYCRPPPDFDKVPAIVRVNAAAILREDSLLRKQDAKDAQALKNYEIELRDANEYHLWQQKMREIDATSALQQVELRRELAKQSAEEAREAIQRAKEDNKAVAELLREQAKAIKLQKQLEEEIVYQRNREIAQTISEARDTLPKIAMQKVVQSKEEAALRLREELEESRRRKAQQDRIEEALRAERTRQLKTLNTVVRKPVVVFDPTEIAGEAFLDEMSYLEMKERAAMERARLEALEEEKRREILVEKEKKSRFLEEKALSIQRAREMRASAAIALRGKKQLKQAKIEEAKRIALERSAEAMKKELAAKRELRMREKQELAAEQAKAINLIQTVMNSQETLAQTRERQLALAIERQERKRVKEIELILKNDERVRKKEVSNKAAEAMNQRKKRHEDSLNKQNDLLHRKKEATEQLKRDLLRKKAMNVIGIIQHERTREVVQGSNMYASKISQCDIDYGRSLTKIKRTSSAK